MRINAGPPRKMYFLFIVEADPQDSYSCDTCTIGNLETEECYIEYEKKLTRYQLATKISVYMDLSKIMNNELNQVSPCLIVNHENEFEKACVECLQSTHLENSKYESRMSASPFN